MPAQIVQLDEKTNLVFGLTWKTLDFSDSPAKQRAEERQNGARYYVQFKTPDEEQWIGTCPELSDHEGEIKGQLISGAAQIAMHPDLYGKTALVLLQMPSQDGPGQVAAVWLVNGSVYDDQLINPSDVNDLRAKFRQEAAQQGSTTGEELKVWGHSETIAPPEEKFEWGDLLVAKQKIALGILKRPYLLEKLKPELPKWALWLLFAVIMLAILGSAGAMYWKKYQAQAMAQLAKAQKKAPTPEELYSQSRARFMQTPMLSAASALKLRAYVGSLDVQSAGWWLKSAECSAVGCTMSYTRDKGATFETFATANAGKFDAINFASPDLITTNKALALEQQPPKPESEWLKYSRWQVGERSLWQVWTDAGIPVEFTPVSIDALPDGGNAGQYAALPNAIYSLKYTMTDAPLQYFDVLAELPHSTSLESLVFNFTKEKTQTQGKFTATGKILVSSDKPRN